MRHNCIGWASATLALAFVSFACAGCTATKQARSAEPSGFLTGKLYEGKEGQALLVYFAPDAQWSKYTKIQMDPITVWANDQLASVPKDELQVLVDYADSSIREALKSDYGFVDRPGPEVMRLRVAITQAKGSPVVLDTLSTVVPQLRALATVKQIATGTAAFVGEAGVEAELLDSMTNRRLAAAVDRRVGQKKLIEGGLFNKWDDVQQGFDYWAERLKTRLAELRGAKS
jgi:hypothetical protein